MPQWTDRDGVRRVSEQLTEILTRGYQTSPDPDSGAMDLAALKAGVLALGEQDSAVFLQRISEDIDEIVRMYSQDTRESYEAHTETVLAVMDIGRQRLSKRFGNNAQAAIRALGAYPLAEDETVADRYRQLQWSVKQASKFGAQRKANHLLCVRASMSHLAQVGGYPDAVRMEVALDADLAAEAAESTTGWDVGEYRLSVAVSGVEATIVVERGGKRLKAVPKPVRDDPAYGEARELQERLRSQARRLRFGLLEGLVTEGTPIAVADVRALLRMPAGREMIPALIWRTPEGVTGLLEVAEPAETGGAGEVLVLRGLDGEATAVDDKGELYAAHPWDLFDAGTLSRWQRAVVGRRITQPVRQAFRELYVLTPAEVDAGTHSARFAGHRVGGARANRLLGARSWHVDDRREDEAFATRRFGEYEARLEFEESGHFLGEGEPITGKVGFRRGNATIPFTEVPPTVLSEAMRDVDLVVSVAGVGSFDLPTSSATVASRGELLAALAEDLGLASSITVDGSFAHVAGSRADYRVHLGSGSIHIEPGGYLCIVPDAAAAGQKQRLFLPFADEDVLTSVILSKVLMLVADDRITDPSILGQIERIDRAR